MWVYAGELMDERPANDDEGLYVEVMGTEITDAMIDRGASVYRCGRAEATAEEIRAMAEDVIRAALRGCAS